jgi:hypothetical protein
MVVEVNRRMNKYHEINEKKAKLVVKEWQNGGNKITRYRQMITQL